MLWHFFNGTTPDQVTPAVVLAYAHGIGLSGKPPSRVTIGARIACLSSYFHFLIRMGLVTSNPCDLVERPRQSPAPARGFSADEVRRILDVVPDTFQGRRDRAILLVFILTGRRRSEVMELKAGDITIEDSTVYYSYRGKGGKRGRRELPRPAWDAIRRTLADCGKEITSMDPEESLWQAGAGPKGLSGSTFYARFRSEAQTRRWRVDRGGEFVPRPLELGRHADLSTPARRGGGPLLGACGRVDRGLSRGGAASHGGGTPSHAVESMDE